MKAVLHNRLPALVFAFYWFLLKSTSTNFFVSVMIQCGLGIWEPEFLKKMPQKMFRKLKGPIQKVKIWPRLQNQGWEPIAGENFSWKCQFRTLGFNLRLLEIWHFFHLPHLAEELKVPKKIFFVFQSNRLKVIFVLWISFVCSMEQHFWQNTLMKPQGLNCLTFSRRWITSVEWSSMGRRMEEAEPPEIKY